MMSVEDSGEAAAMDTGAEEPGEVSRASVLQLISQKEELEQRITVLSNVLTSQSVGMDDQLVDAEGYPRNDIDVYAVRHARAQIRRLQTDHTALMRQIEAGLTALHSQQRPADSIESAADPPPPQVPTPFLQVGAVRQGSPADVAGLKSGDQLAQFGSVNFENFSTLADVSGVVQHSVGQPVRLVVVRDGRQMTISVTPGQWSGRGLLGCSLTPIDHPER